MSVNSTATLTTGVTQSSNLEATVGGYSTAGVKPINEDAFAALMPSGTSKVLKGITACLADGVSTSANAKQASQISVTTFINDYYSTPDSWAVRTAVGRVLGSLNNWLFYQGQKAAHGYSNEHESYVTTFSGIICKSTTAHIFHVGDSRVYRLRDNRLEQLTTDHCRFQGGNKTYLTRALGIDSHLEVDYQQQDLQTGDIFILTTDGVHEFLSPKDAIQIIEQNPDKTWEEKSQLMIELAIERGSDDNLTCLCLEITALPEEDIDEAHRRLTELKIPPVMEVGMKIDGYEVLQVIHSGTRSHIYLVKHPNHQRRFILKAPSENFSEDPQYLEGFIREQWVGRRLNSERVMKIFPHDDKSPFLYHLCEYIEGQTLRQWMYDNPEPSLTEVRKLLEQAIHAMRVLQRAGMVHRDIKPENLLITPSGQVKVIDFGTVQVDGLEEVGSIIDDNTPVGSVNYIAPEYLLGGRGQSQSDLFSLGVMVYEMLTGEMPFNLDNAHRRLPTHLQSWQYRSLREKRQDLPVWVDKVLEKATHPNLRERYQALSEFLQDLTTPNPTLMRKHNQAPLLQRSPSQFWMFMSIFLGIVVLVQAFLLSMK